MTAGADQEANSDEASGADPSLAGNSLEQIREILFGSQSRDIDDRLQAMNDQFFEAIGNMRSMLTERSDALHRKLEQEIRGLHEELNTYRREQQQRSDGLDEKLNNTANDLRQQLGALSETLNGTEQSVREDMNRGFEELKTNFSKRMDELREQMQQNLSQLSSSSVKRRALSEALLQLSSQFSEE